ncbi:hypothetical protein BGZ99_009649 [Dissophora globulifera]|uniref:Enoyl reductase (ER) domain-containing protein n=1 Tax=Dissophora globulifera TaxID=979702 RepID=A0A9P6R818_9FUNG|nr:hypothetical protein BGZ99_009649 [Dissophora globulifera]
MAQSNTLLANTRIIRASYANKSRVTNNQFRIETHQDVDLQSVKPGEIILRNLYLSLDPYVRFSLDETGGDLPLEYRKLNDIFYGLGIAEVVASGVPKYPIGTLVSGSIGYENFTRLTGLDDPNTQSDLRILPPHARDESTGVPLSNYISALGMPGLTAFSGLKMLGVEKGKTIFVGSAAGGVGQLVGQLAKIQGLTVIGSAGTDEKVAYLVKTQHFDGAFNYKTDDAREALLRLAPQGIDYYYDTVGGEILDLVLELINEKGKILSVGMVSQENGSESYPIRNLKLIARRGVSILGFIYWHHLQYFENGELDATVRPLLEQKKVNYREEVFAGIENTPEHFINMLDGKYAGKVVIKIADL